MDLAISVALAAHNGSRFVAEQVRSILSQTRPVDEIVVSDDASSDDTVAIVRRELAEHSGRGGRDVSLTIVENTAPLGVTANFEQALRTASGDLIALCDQDDVWHPDRVAAAVDVFARRPGVQLVASDARLVDAEGTPIGTTMLETLGATREAVAHLDGDGALAELLRRNLLTGATMMVRRELVERGRPFPSSWVHDEWLAVVAAISEGVAVVDRPLIDYRQHGSNEIGAETVGFRTKLDRLAEPRTERNRRLLARAEALVERAPALVPEAAGGILDEFRHKLAHEQVRSALPRRRLARVRPVVREWRTGRYARYGLGAQDVLRDLVQPA